MVKICSESKFNGYRRLKFEQVHQEGFDMQLKDIMTKTVKCCSPDTTLEEVASIMWNEDVGIVPVVDSGEYLSGLITDRDIAMAAVLKHRPIWEITAREMIGGQSCHCCFSEDDVHEALRVMDESRVRRVPIVDEKKRLLGIVGLKDIANHAVAQKGPRKSSQLTTEDFTDAFRHISKPNELKATA